MGSGLPPHDQTTGANLRISSQPAEDLGMSDVRLRLRPGRSADGAGEAGLDRLGWRIEEAFRVREKARLYLRLYLRKSLVHLA